METLPMIDVNLLQKTWEIARESVAQGNLPFGCLLADASGTILEQAGNTVVTDHNPIAHCELNLVLQIAGKYDAEFLQACTIYCSVEPCPMCAGAIFWSGIGRIVFALDTQAYNRISQVPPTFLFEIPCKGIIEKGGRSIEVIGPALQKETVDFYESLFRK